MPSMISSATEVRPLRLLFVVGVIAFAAYAAGVFTGTNAAPDPAPACTVSGHR